MTILLRKTKRKVRRDREGNHVSEREERMTSFTQETKRKLIKHFKGRKEGPLFHGYEGKRFTDRAVQKMVHTYAVKLGIQKIVGYDSQKKPHW